VYSHGIVVLATLSAGLLIGFGGITDRLIPLFAIGAFLAFTLSQAGMVVHWRKEGGAHAGKSMVVNGAGAVSTAVTLVVVLVSKFLEGAWVMILLIPALIVMFMSVHRHYQSVGRQLATSEPLDVSNMEAPIILLPVRGWSAITRRALRFALELSHEVYALHIAGDEHTMAALEDGWKTLVVEPAKSAGLSPPKLIVMYSPYRRLYMPLQDALTDLRRAHPVRDIAVIIPELIATRWYHFLLHNQTGVVIEAYLRLSGFRRVVVINVPWYLEE
jgi:hypothetical protein